MGKSPAQDYVAAFDKPRIFVAEHVPFDHARDFWGQQEAQHRASAENIIFPNEASQNIAIENGTRAIDDIEVIAKRSYADELFVARMEEGEFRRQHI